MRPSSPTAVINGKGGCATENSADRFVPWEDTRGAWKRPLSLATPAALPREYHRERKNLPLAPTWRRRTTRCS